MAFIICDHYVVTVYISEFGSLSLIFHGRFVACAICSDHHYQYYTGYSDIIASILICRSFCGQNGVILHDALMYTLSLNHENEKDRKTFVKILNYCKDINRTVGIEKIEYAFSTSPWIITTERGDEFEKDIYIDVYDFEDETLEYWRVLRYAIAYKTDEGVHHLKSDYRPGSCNGSCGYVTTSAVMTDEMKQKIYSMGLIPALYESGSYHENWIYAVGILPKFLTQIKNDENLKDTIFFNCKF